MDKQMKKQMKIEDKRMFQIFLFFQEKKKRSFLQALVTFEGKQKPAKTQKKSGTSLRLHQNSRFKQAVFFLGKIFFELFQQLSQKAPVVANLEKKRTVP